ncbi:hypothetical protein [Streptomyces sp. NPDC059063]|uniref:hypothetical protein n=1 Tax=Streptomyces sp. NPDC059063 TaxID=3346712 RepID=UPI0036CD423A
MALRGSPAYRLQDNPLGGVLRDLDRRSRAATRRRGKTTPATTPEAPDKAAEGRAGPRGPRGPQGPPGEAAAFPVVAVTDEEGRARITFPAGHEEQPVVTVTAVGAAPLLPVLEEVTPGHVIVRVWLPEGMPAPAGIQVHLVAMASFTPSS